MEGGGVESDSELSSIAVAFVIDRLLRVEYRVVGVLLGREDVEGLPQVASVGFFRLNECPGEES